MTAIAVAAAVGLTIVAFRPRPMHLDAFLATTTPEPPIARRYRLGSGPLIGLVAGLVIGATSMVPMASAAVVGTAAGGMVGRFRRSQRHDRRIRHLEMELPIVADMLALHILAGDSVAAAIKRVADQGAGLLPSELAEVAGDDADGLEGAIRRAARATVSDQARRLFELLAHAHRAGGRLADALTSLADDVRERLAADLTAEGGRRSLAVYGPILAFMVPVTLVFLMYPTLTGLTALSNP